MKPPVISPEETAVDNRRRALGRAFYELRRAERDDSLRKERTTSRPATKAKSRSRA